MAQIPEPSDIVTESQQKKTKQIPKRSNHLQFLQTGKLNSPEQEDELILTERKFLIVIRGLREEHKITNTETLLIGRLSLDNDPQVDIDLDPYGAGRYGVSRTHAQLTLDDRRHLYITDLESTNGTMLAGRKLKPGVRSLVHNGDKIVCGTLMMQLYFR